MLRALILSLATILGFANQSPAAPIIPIPLWPGDAPGALGTNMVDVPTVTPFLPDATNTTGAAMIICPGGGYEHLSPPEGNDYALWLNQHGVTCFVLRYRLGSNGYHHPVQLQDAARAVRWVRANADKYGIDVKRVGIMGSSAGGHLAATLMTHFDEGNPDASDRVERESSRPDLGVLCYPVITMGYRTHTGSRNALLGTNQSPEMLKALSLEFQVRDTAPPCFIWSTFEDRIVPMENTMLFASALRSKRIPVELHVYEKGEHGMGLGDTPPFHHPHRWANDCLAWLKLRNFTD